VSFSNAGTLQSRIRTYQRLRERRVLVTLGVVYQGINLAVFRRFGDAGIEFAYPSRALLVQHTNAPDRVPDRSGTRAQ